MRGYAGRPVSGHDDREPALRALHGAAAAGASAGEAVILWKLLVVLAVELVVCVAALALLVWTQS